MKRWKRKACGFSRDLQMPLASHQAQRPHWRAELAPLPPRVEGGRVSQCTGREPWPELSSGKSKVQGSGPICPQDLSLSRRSGRALVRRCDPRSEGWTGVNEGDMWRGLYISDPGRRTGLDIDTQAEGVIMGSLDTERRWHVGGCEEGRGGWG